MRTSHTARLASAIAIAFAGQAYAATAVTTSSAGSHAATSSTGTVTGTNSNLIRSSTAVPAPSNNASTSTGNTTTNNNGTNTNTSTSTTSGTNVDVRNLQTQQAVAGTHASGSTSALGPLATGNASVNSPTTAGTGTTSGLGATGTGSSTGTNTGSAAGSVPFIVTPIYSNPSDVTAGFAMIPAANGSVMANGIAGNDVYAGAVTAPDVTLAANAANGASVDRAINQVSRDRKRVGRNGQLLYSIAPRGNGVDRSREMPDDAPSPALTGSNSTLAR